MESVFSHIYISMGCGNSLPVCVFISVIRASFVNNSSSGPFILRPNTWRFVFISSEIIQLYLDSDFTAVVRGASNIVNIDFSSAGSWEENPENMPNNDDDGLPRGLSSVAVFETSDSYLATFSSSSVRFGSGVGTLVGYILVSDGSTIESVLPFL